MSKAKEALKRYMETIEKGGCVEWARKTKFVPQPDGSLRRMVTRKDGTVEKDEIIPEYLRKSLHNCSASLPVHCVTGSKAAGIPPGRPRRCFSLPQNTLRY
jgi:hypothetical protein